jgi:cold shock CspA family protein
MTRPRHGSLRSLVLHPHEERAPPQPNKNGTVKWFDQNLEYGFIVDDASGEEIFLHGSAISDRRIPSKGDAVVYSAGTRKNGKFGALSVKVL